MHCLVDLVEILLRHLPPVSRHWLSQLLAQVLPLVLRLSRHLPLLHLPTPLSQLLSAGEPLVRFESLPSLFAAILRIWLPLLRAHARTRGSSWRRQQLLPQSFFEFRVAAAADAVANSPHRDP